MTMPHLMNCKHSGGGWCVNCVEDLQTKLDLVGDVCKSLETQLSDKTKVCEAQKEFIKRLEAEKNEIKIDFEIFAGMVSRTKRSDAWGNCVDEANKILKTEKKA